MPIHVTWLQEPFIRLVRYEDVVTTEDFEALLAEELALCEYISNPFYIILDTHKITKLAANPLRLSGFMKLVRHPKLACCMMVAENPTSHFWAKTISQIVRFAPIHITRSIDEAVEYATHQIGVPA